jgi:hypothetical protein
MNTPTLTSTFSSTVPAWIHANGALLVVLILWSLFWKGLALWHAGRRGHAGWFVVMLVVNTAGILEIIYLFAILKIKFSHLFSK